MIPSLQPGYYKRWRIEHERGHTRIVAPDRAEAHVKELVATLGVSIRSIAAASGLGPSVVSNLNRGIATGLHRDTEASILAVTAESIRKRPDANGFVPNIGARRRVQALLAIGWRYQDLTPQLGFNSSAVVLQAGEWITRRKHDRVKELYDLLWNTKGPATAVSLNRASVAAYAPPMAWDDETMDDPNATPNTNPVPQTADDGDTDTSSRRMKNLVEDVEFLITTGVAWEHIPARLNTGAFALERALYRLKRHDLVARAKTNTNRGNQ